MVSFYVGGGSRFWALEGRDFGGFRGWICWMVEKMKVDGGWWLVVVLYSGADEGTLFSFLKLRVFW